MDDRMMVEGKQGEGAKEGDECFKRRCSRKWHRFRASLLVTLISVHLHTFINLYHTIDRQDEARYQAQETTEDTVSSMGIAQVSQRIQSGLKGIPS